MKFPISVNSARLHNINKIHLIADGQRNIILLMVHGKYEQDN
jgi:hypothetical protein